MNNEKKNHAEGFAGLIARLERKHKRYMNRALAAEGITGVTYTYVMAIKNNPGISQERLAEIQGVDKSRVARLVRKLELGGYLSRNLLPQDRRQYSVTLTDEGIKLYQLLSDKSAEWEKLVCAGVCKEDLRKMIDVLKRIEYCSQNKNSFTEPVNRTDKILTDKKNEKE